MVADEFIAMDSENPYTGDHSPLVKLDKTELHGFMQSGLAVRNGRAYTGRIVLAGSPTATVKVTLVWGNEAGDQQTVTIPTLGSTYRKFPLTFVAKADSYDARLEIAGTGVGAFHAARITNGAGNHEEASNRLYQQNVFVHGPSHVRCVGGEQVGDLLKRESQKQADVFTIPRAVSSSLRAKQRNASSSSALFSIEKECSGLASSSRLQESAASS